MMSVSILCVLDDSWHHRERGLGFGDGIRVNASAGRWRKRRWGEGIDWWHHLWRSQRTK